MSKITARELEAYDAKLQRIVDAASDGVARAYKELRARSLDADIAQIREGVIEIIEASLSTYGDMACEVAASFYDDLARHSHELLKSAELPPIDGDTLRTIARMVRRDIAVLIEENEREDI